MSEWKLVPVDPTPGMSAKGFCVSEAEHDPAGVYRAMLSAAPTPPTCPECNGEYAIDSGGTHPWGEAALIPCPKCSPTPPEVEPVGEVVSEELGQPFNAAQIRANFYKAIPPVGTKLYTSPPPPADDELRKAVKKYVKTCETGSFDERVRDMQKMVAALNKGES